MSEQINKSIMPDYLGYGDLDHYGKRHEQQYISKQQIKR